MATARISIDADDADFLIAFRILVLFLPERWVFMSWAELTCLFCSTNELLLLLLLLFYVYYELGQSFVVIRLAGKKHRYMHVCSSSHESNSLQLQHSNWCRYVGTCLSTDFLASLTYDAHNILFVNDYFDRIGFGRGTINIPDIFLNLILYTTYVTLCRLD